ncbi:metalloregulator ArsR/SmtB family transcription factor [Demetria terragena]|uniref:ArsR/SmtB family transcription factor n=1 Tax=Demetria terragena TaxID=63959 RepID=UPI00036ADC1F
MISESSETELAESISPAALFRALGDPGRLTLLRHLLLSEHNVRELTEHLGLAQSTVSGHLACLRDCGLITSRPIGRSSAYAVTEPTLVAALLKEADRLLGATDDMVVECPTASGGHKRHRCRTRGSCRICPHTAMAHS